MVGRSSRWVGVPELSLENLTPWRIEAACVLHGGGVVAAQLRIGTRRRLPGIDGFIWKQRHLRRAQRELGDRT